MKRLIAAAVGGLVALLGGCGSYQRVELVNSTPETVSVSVATAGGGRAGCDAEPRADVAPGGRFRYVGSGGKSGSGEVRVTPRTPGLMEARLAVGGGTFRGWIRRSGGALVIEPAGGDLPPW